MTLVESYLPDAPIRQIDRVDVAAPPDVAWAHVRVLDLHRATIVRWLFGLRTIPTRLGAWLAGEPAPALPQHLHVEDVVAPYGAFAFVDEDPGRELVVGAVGTFWRPDVELRYVERERFATFAEPGWGKLACSVRVDRTAPPFGGAAGRAQGPASDTHDRGSTITCELRIAATDDVSWKKLARYWRVVGPLSRAIRRGVLRRLEDDLGRVARRAA